MLARKGETNKSGRKKRGSLSFLTQTSSAAQAAGDVVYFPQQQSEPLNKKNRSRTSGAVQPYVSIQEKQQRQAQARGFIG